MLTKAGEGGRGLSQILTIAGQGGGEGSTNPIFWLTKYVNSPLQ